MIFTITTHLGIQQNLSDATTSLSLPTVRLF